MNAHEAIAGGKSRIIDLFQDEKIVDVGLEEVEYDDIEHVWILTFGFSRPWDKVHYSSLFAQMSETNQHKKPNRRTYKVIRLSDRDGEMLSIKNRETQN